MTAQQQTQAQPGDRVLVGRVSGVEPRSNDWYRFSIHQDGDQYPIKVDTKKAEIVNATLALINQTVTCWINEKVSDRINENSGKPFINRYLNQIAPGVVAAATPSTVTQPQAQPAAQPATHTTTQVGAQVDQSLLNAARQQPQDDSWRVKEIHIMREVASERAIQMAAAKLLPEDQMNTLGMIKAAEVWFAYFDLGPGRFLEQNPQQVPASGQDAASGGFYDYPPPDDDIPF